MSHHRRVKVFEYKDHAVIFDPAAIGLSLLPLESNSGQAGTDSRSSEAARVSGFINQQLREHGAAPSSDASADEAVDSNGDPRPTLGKLILTVSNTCNMTCSYCYAAAGTYYNKPGVMMSRETAFNAINRASRAFSKIGHINFFGGEPTLNREIIELACEYVIYLHKRGVLSDLPSFGVTTNGYAIDGATFDMFERYGFSVTVSLDGPKEVHDRKRQTRTGQGTHDAIMANIKTLIDRGIEPEFECTYSNEHLRCGVDIVALMDFFYDNFGCRTLHSPIVAAAPDTPEFIPWETCLKLQGDAIRYSMRNLVQGIPKSISTATRLMDAFVTGTPIRSYCPAGRSALTINADGYIYACFMLMQDTGCSYGNVNTKEESGRADGHSKETAAVLPVINSRTRTGCGSNLSAAGLERRAGSDQHAIQSMISDADKGNNPACQKCWAQPLCHGCLGEDLERLGSSVPRSEIPGESAFCDYKRGIAEVFLESVAEAYLSVNGQEARIPRPEAEGPPPTAGCSYS